MIVISVRFNKNIYSKKYEYLLVNPNNYKIEKEVALISAVGAMKGRIINSYLYIDNVRRVQELPSIVSKQIVVLDENNNIRIENLGCLVSKEEFYEEEIIDFSESVELIEKESKKKKTKKKEYCCSSFSLTQDQLEKRLLGHKIRRR